MQLFLSVIAALALLIFIIYLATVWSTLQLTLQCFRAESTETKELPEHIAIILEPVIAELEQCGFSVSGSYLTDSVFANGGKDEQLLLQNNEQQTHAWIGVRTLPDKANPVSIIFVSFFTDNHLLMTQNERLPRIYSQVSQETHEHFDGESVRKQWHSHQCLLEKLCESKIPQALTPESFTSTYEAYAQRHLEQLVRTKELHWVKPGALYRYSIGIACKIVFWLMWNRLSKKLDPSAPSHALASGPIGTEANLLLEVREFQRWQQRSRSGSRRAKSWWLLGSLALFIASYAALLDPQKLFIFVAVLLLHEGGHVLAMKFFGYRDAAMLFIPFLGALATARKEDATLTEKVWISLAGPLPGLFLGIGLAIATSLHYTDSAQFMRWYTARENWVRDATGILIGLNLFNLMPMYPLDGGQVADLLLFSRNPYLGVAFKSLGVLVLSLLGLKSPLLLMFAMLISLTIPTSFRLAKLNAKLRRDARSIPLTDREGLTQHIFAQLQQPPYQSLPFSKKYVLAIALLQSYKENSAKWTTRLGLTSLYLLSLFAGVLGALFALMPNWGILSNALNAYTQNPLAAHHSRMQKELIKANRLLKSNPQDIQAQLRKARAQLGLKDYQSASFSVNQILKLDPQSSEGYRLRGIIRRQAGDVVGADADQAKGQQLALSQEIQQLNLLLHKNPQNLDAYVQRANAYFSSNRYPEALADVKQALRLDSKNIDVLLIRGEIYFSSQDYKAAISDASQAIALDSEIADAFDLRSRARLKLGDHAGAGLDEKKAQALYETD
jgi:tetratricopeptide (TPR) repeat protein/Zn-dependent protease